MSYSKVFWVVAICVIGIIAYSNTFHSPFYFDDGHTIIENQEIRDLSNLKALGHTRSRFITYLTFAINYHFHKLDVFGYHLVNLIIHLGSAIMVWWLTLITLSTSPLKDNKIARHSSLIAFFAALIFVAHPVQIQAVTYITQRATSLLAFFYISSLCLYVKFRLSQINNLSFRVRLLYLFGLFATATLGMFTKELIVTLPLMIFLYEVCFLRIRDYFKWRYLVIPIILLIAIHLAILSPRFLDFSSFKEASCAHFETPPVQYILTQFRVLVTYLRLFFIPINQNIDYDYPVVKTILEFPVLASIFLLLVILIAALKLYPRYRLMSFGIFWFFIALLQEFTIMPLFFFLLKQSREIIFEERLYIPMVGYSLFLVSAIYYIFGHRNKRRMVIILLAIVTSYAVMTYNRNAVWKDEFTLWDDAVRKSPNKVRPHNDRGRAYANKGNLDEAIADFNKAIQLNPNYGKAYYNRGLAYHKKGNLENAISDYKKAIIIIPDYKKAYNNLGYAYFSIGEDEEAMELYKKAIEIDTNQRMPNYEIPYNNLANIYSTIGKKDEAIDLYKKAIGINPDYADAHNNLAVAYYHEGQYDLAIEHYDKAIELGYEINPEFLKLLGPYRK